VAACGALVLSEAPPLSRLGVAQPVVAVSAASAASISRFLPTLREAAPGLDGFTVYRPVDLSAAGDAVPVLLWGNGACKSSNHQYWDVLGAVAARGFVVVAFGAAEQVTVKESNTVTPARMQRSLEWVVGRAKTQKGYERIDPRKIGVFGTSCGGIEALLAAADPRVKAVAGLNTGFFPAGSTGSTRLGGFSDAEIAKLHTPLLLLGGGPSDVAYPQTHTNYEASTVKTVLAENPQGGHSGLWAGLRYTLGPDGKTATGSDVDYTITTDAVGAVVRWFDFTLNGNTAEAAYFLGRDCGLCTLPGWTVRSKHF
jgi:dienelactone hydrolase